MIKIEKIKIENFGCIDKFEANLDNIVLLHNDGISDKINDLMLVIKYFFNIDNPFTEHDFDSIVNEFNEKTNKATNIEILFMFDNHYFIYNHTENDSTVTDYVSRFKMKGLLCYNFMRYIFNSAKTSYGYISSSVDNYALSDYSNELKDVLHRLKFGLQIDSLDISLMFNEDRYNKAYNDILEEFSYFNPLVIDTNLRLFLSENGVKIMDDSGNKLNKKDLDKQQFDAFNFGCFLVLNKLLDNVLKMEDDSLINAPLIVSHSLDNLSSLALENTLNNTLVKYRQIFLEQDTLTLQKLENLIFKQFIFITEIDNNILIKRTVK